MKTLYNYLFIISLSITLGGCIDDTYNPNMPLNIDEVAISFHVSVPVDNLPVTKQAPSQFSDNTQENTIQKIDILAFKVNADNTEYFDYYAEGKLVSGVGTPKQTFRAIMRIKDYKQRFVIIANAHDEVMELIGSVEWRKAPKDEMLKLLEFANKASDHKWNASNTAEFTPFPMWGEMAAPQLINSNTNINGISMLRMVAKIDVLVADKNTISGKKPRENFKLTEVYLYNIKDNGHVVPDKSTFSYPSAGLVVNKPTIPAAPGNWTGPLKYITDNEISLIDEIYTLEAAATDLSKNRSRATGLVIGGYYSKDGVNWDTAPSYYRLDIMTTDKTATRDILRNHNYLLRIVDVKGPGSPTPELAWNGSVSMDMMIADWELQTVPGDILKRQLNISAAKVTITGMTSSRIYFWSDQPIVKVEEQGYIGATETTPFVVNQYFDDLAGDTNTSMFHYNPQTREGYMDIATISTSVQSDTRRIYLNAGGLRREIIIDTDVKCKPKPFSDFPWVGTFHRNNEIGERIIYSDNEGDWSAQVDDPQTKGSFVILSKVPSDNKDLGSDSPGNAEDYPVLNGVKSVKGNGRIYFRIGMVSTYTSTAKAPARYASITVKHSGGTNKMYVRQGQEADFLMRNVDVPMKSCDITQRTLARKFSPYNLTDRNGEKGRVGNATGSKYVFTKYPSQAGYYFQWGKTYAWYPDGVHPVDWSLEDIEDVWDNIKTKSETCPDGYHRPNDGPTDDFVKLPLAIKSEIRQSLYLNPSDANNSIPPGYTNSIWGHEDSDNSIWGYLADGFFDRRTPRDSFDGHESAVVGSGAELAYQGRLFFNPYTNASVFFPASGVRDGDNVIGINRYGAIELSGIRAYFWTTTRYDKANPLYQSASPLRSFIVETGNRKGFPIRCMKDE